MSHLHLILFTLLWTAVWVAPLPRLSPRVELLAGLIPFAAFGLRVFSGFFEGVPAADPVRSAVEPLLTWVRGGAGWLPYDVVLDAAVALGLVWFAVAFDIPKRSRIATAWIMPTVAFASIASTEWLGQPLTQALAARLPAALLAGLAGGCIAAVIGWTPSDVPPGVRCRAAVVALVTTPVTAAVGAAAAALAGALPDERQAAAVSVIALATGATAAMAAGLGGGFVRPRSRWLFALTIGVAAGATVLGTATDADDPYPKLAWPVNVPEPSLAGPPVKAPAFSFELPTVVPYACRNTGYFCRLSTFTGPRPVLLACSEFTCRQG